MRFRYVRRLNPNAKTPKERIAETNVHTTISHHMWPWLALLNKLDGRGAHISYG